MRLSRWLLLAAILTIVAYVGQTYVKRQQTLARDTPAPPPPLETGIDGRANDWVYTQSDGKVLLLYGYRPFSTLPLGA